VVSLLACRSCPAPTSVLSTGRRPSELSNTISTYALSTWWPTLSCNNMRTEHPHQGLLESRRRGGRYARNATPEVGLTSPTPPWPPRCGSSRAAGDGAPPETGCCSGRPARSGWLRGRAGQVPRPVAEVLQFAQAAASAARQHAWENKQLLCDRTAELSIQPHTKLLYEQQVSPWKKLDLPEPLAPTAQQQRQRAGSMRAEQAWVADRQQPVGSGYSPATAHPEQTAGCVLLHLGYSQTANWHRVFVVGGGKRNCSGWCQRRRQQGQAATLTHDIDLVGEGLQHRLVLVGLEPLDDHLSERAPAAAGGGSERAADLVGRSGGRRAVGRAGYLLDVHGARRITSGGLPCALQAAIGGGDSCAPPCRPAALLRVHQEVGRRDRGPQSPAV